MYEIYINKTFFSFDRLINVTLSFKKWKRKVYKISVIKYYTLCYFHIIYLTCETTFTKMNSRNKSIFSNAKASFTFAKNQKTHASYLLLCNTFTNGEQKLIYTFIDNNYIKNNLFT